LVSYIGRGIKLLWADSVGVLACGIGVEGQWGLEGGVGGVKRSGKGTSLSGSSFSRWSECKSSVVDIFWCCFDWPELR
jgi:hypothetical protein